MLRDRRLLQGEWQQGRAEELGMSSRDADVGTECPREWGSEMGWDGGMWMVWASPRIKMRRDGLLSLTR
jgi:hypothetical protein